MAHHPDSDSDLDARDDPGAGPQGRSTSTIPRWLKLVGITVLALVLLLVIALHLIAGGVSGPHQ